MRIVYMGTPEFAVRPLEMLVSSGHEVVCVITQPDKPKNRGKKLQPTPVKAAALEHGLTVLQPEKVKSNQALLDRLSELNPDLGIVAAYGKLLPLELLELPRLGCINIHASLLPKLRGAAPIQRAILEGFQETGVTIMQMAEGLDTGDMLAKKSIAIENRNASELYDVLSVLGAQLLQEVLPALEAGTVTPTPQEEAEATYAPMISKQTGLVEFNRGAAEIQCQIRAMDPWPAAFCFYEGIPVKLKEAEVQAESEAKDEAAPGTILSVSKNGMEVACGHDALLVKRVQFPNKKAMTVEEYTRGNEIKIGVILKSEE